MYKLYRPLKFLCISILFLGLGTGLLSDQINTYVKEGKFVVAPFTVQLLHSPVVLYPSLTVLAGLFILTLIARKSNKKFKQRNHFDLFKATNELTPEDLGFTALPKGEVARPGERPYYEGYLSRTYQSKRQSDQKNEIPTTEPEVLACIKRGDSILLTGQPTEGKTRTAYELLKGLNDFTVTSVKPDSIVPQDAFSIIKGKRVVFFIDDLSSFIGRPADLNRLYTEAKNMAKQCVILATCRSEPEVNEVAHPISNLNRFYENFTHELSLVPITEEQKQKIASGTGLSLKSERTHRAPTPGWVVMDDARLTMKGRFMNLSREATDTLCSLLLLGVAGIGPPTHQRIKSILTKVFQRSNIHLTDILADLFKNNFIKISAIHDPVQPEHAYLEEIVTYRDGRHPRKDFDTLGQMLIDTQDAEGLHYLAITLAIRLKDYIKAFGYLQQAVTFKPSFYEAYYSMGLVFYEAGNKYIQLEQPMLAFPAYEKSISAYEKALEINPSYYQAWNNLGIIYNNLEQYEKAIEAYDRAGNIKTNLAPHKARYNKGLARCNMKQYEKAVKDFQQATEIKPDYHQAWDNLAYTFVLLERYDEALGAIQTALQYAPDDIKYWATLRVVLSHLNREDAVLWLCKAWRAWMSLSTHPSDTVKKELREAFIRLELTPDVCGGGN